MFLVVMQLHGVGLVALLLTLPLRGYGNGVGGTLGKRRVVVVVVAGVAMDRVAGDIGG